VEIRIHNPDNDGVGEVFARGPNVMLGYFGNRDATKAILEDDGWLHTGDLGKLDRRGQLVLSGRSKDVIVSTSGENVYPDDVEDMLGHVKYVDELSVVGMDDARGNEIVACIAVPERNDDDDRARAHDRAIRELKKASEKLPRHCQPKMIHLYDAELPKTATRKVKRSEVKKILERLSAAAAPRAEASGHGESNLASVQQAIAAIAAREASTIQPEMNLATDLGFDSLMSMELTVALEKQLGRTLDSEEISQVETVADLTRLLGSSRSQRSITTIEKDDPETVHLPAPVARVAKDLLTRAQMGFYDNVMKPHVYGRSFIPHNRNTIVVSNHVSHLDMGFVKYALGKYGEDIVGLAAADYFFAGKWRRSYFEQLTNLHAFERKTNLRQALRKASEPIKLGRNVLLFPEGTRSKDGQVHEFKSTLGHLALGNHVDILPVYLGGTYESWPKGRRIPTKREIRAHIGPPLEHTHLARLTAGMAFSKACRVVAQLARQAVITMQRGGVLDLSEFETVAEALGERKQHPLVTLFRDLESNFVAGKVDEPLTYYFSLGNEAEAKWTLRIEPDKCHAEIGKPAGQSADCVLKTTTDMFTKMVREGYMPTPVEIMSGLVKSNDVSLLAKFQEAFGIG